MSLINQVLRDLDRRHASAVDRASMPNAVHVSSERRKPRLPLVAALVVLAGVAWFLAGGQVEPLLSPAQVAPQESAPAPAARPPQAQPEPSPQPVSAADPPEQGLPQGQPPLAAELAPPASAKAAASPVVAMPIKPKGVSTNGAARLETAPAAKDKAVATAPPAHVAAAPAAKDMPVPFDPASIDKRPRTSPVHEAAENEYRKAMTALRRGATTEAVERLHAALRQDAGHVSARQALLSLLVEQQQLGEALALMEEGLALDPAQTGWAMALARLQLENGKLADAAETLAHHARYADQNADYLAFQALLMQKQKRYGEAGERYRAAVALKPAESRWWYGLGLSLEADQKPQEAREAFLKAKETGNLPPELASAVDQRLR